MLSILGSGRLRRSLDAVSFSFILSILFFSSYFLFNLLSSYGPIPRWVLEQTTSSPRIQWYSRIEKAPSYTDLSSLTASSTPSIPLSANASSLPPGKQKKSGKVVRKNEEGGMEADSGSISGIRAIGVFHFSLGNQRNFPLSPPFLVPHVTLPNNPINSLRMRLRNSPCPKL